MDLYDNIRRIYSFFNRSIRKQTIVLLCRRVYKIAWANGAKRLRDEFYAAQNAERINSIWKKKGVFLEPITKPKYNLIISTSCRLSRHANNSEIANLLNSLVNNAKEDLSFEIWYKTLDKANLELALSSVPDLERNFICKTLGNLWLPRTGVHGDLIDRNIMIDLEGNSKIIDWEFYRANGSLVTDLLRNHSFRYMEHYKSDLFDPNIFSYAGLPPQLPLEFFWQEREKLTFFQLGLLNALTNVSTGYNLQDIVSNAKKLLSYLRLTNKR